MRNLGECKIAGHVFVVRELTYPQVIDQLSIIKDGDQEPTGLDWLFGKTYMPLGTINAIVEEDVEAFLTDKGLAPSEIEPLYKKAVEINPFLAGALGEMKEIGKLMRMELQSMSENLSDLFGGQPSSSLDGATPGRKNTASPTSSNQ